MSILYEIALMDHPLSHICQQKSCTSTAQMRVDIKLNDGEQRNAYDVCYIHARELVNGCIDVMEL